MQMDDLFVAVKAAVPSFFSSESWYLITASTLVACGKPEDLAPLYIYATGPTSPLTEDEKKHLSVKLQDLLAKAWTLVGIPLVVTASAALAKVEQKNYEGTVAASNWKLPELTPETTARGTAFMKAIYRDNLEPILTSLGTNSGLVEHVDKAIVYGLFLADHSILTELETSLVCVALIMCQGLRAPAEWHIRGLRRLGASEDDVGAAERAIKMVAEWTGKDTEGWATLEDIRDQV